MRDAIAALALATLSILFTVAAIACIIASILAADAINGGRLLGLGVCLWGIAWAFLRLSEIVLPPRDPRKRKWPF